MTLVSVTAVHAAEGESAHVKARLIPESLSVPEGGQVRLVLEHTPAKGWHTYWINAGDAGLPTRIGWNLPDGMTAGEPQWPAPKMLPTLGLNSFGYDGRTSTVITLTNRSGLPAGETLPVRARVNFLVCETQCIPETLEVSTRLTVGPAKPGPDAGRVARAVEALPRTANIAGTVTVKDGVAQLGFKVQDAAARDALSRPQGVYFYPAQEKVLSAAAGQTLDMGAEGFTLRTTPASPALPEGPLSGVLALGDGTAFNISLARGDPPPGTYGLGAAPAPEITSGGLMLAMGLAFLGGMILNLMPCVFPVLSMKLLALSRAGHDHGLARTEALVYGGGAILSFVALAALLQLAQGAGASLGWGFQLQSPYVVAGLAVVMLLVALNMSGVFHVGSSLQGVGGGAFDQKRPLLSAFLTGVLAVIVAAPCTAPFMATAIGVALAQGGVAGFAIFTALGVGFALPIVVLTFLVTLVPGFARVLPRPGPWMNRLKIVLSLLMYAASLWLVWVLAQQVAVAGVILLVLAFAAIIAAVAPIRAMPRLIKAGLLGAGVVLALGSGALPRTERSAAVADTGPSDMPVTGFGVQALTDLRAKGQPVLVDMTAAWCVTCKVNERLVLQTRDVAEALKATGTVYMVGDWTNQDAEISRYLQLYGRSGVPLYVYYGANNAEPKVLPQMLDKADVVRMIKDGAK